MIIVKNLGFGLWHRVCVIRCDAIISARDLSVNSGGRTVNLPTCDGVRKCDFLLVYLTKNVLVWSFIISTLLLSAGNLRQSSVSKLLLSEY